MSDRERESISFLPVLLAGIVIAVLVTAAGICGGFVVMRIWMAPTLKPTPALPAPAPAKLPPKMKAP